MLRFELNGFWYEKRSDGQWYRRIQIDEGVWRYNQLVTNPKMCKSLELAVLSVLSTLAEAPETYTTEIMLKGAGPSGGEVLQTYNCSLDQAC